MQFGVTEALVGRYVLHEDEPAPHADVHGRWYSLEHRLVISRGDPALPYHRSPRRAPDRALRW